MLHNRSWNLQRVVSDRAEVGDGPQHRIGMAPDHLPGYERLFVVIIHNCASARRRSPKEYGQESEITRWHRCRTQR